MTAQLLLLFFVAGGALGPAAAQQADPHAAHRSGSVPAPAQVKPQGGISIADAAVLDQDGRPVRFYSDLVKNKVVAINFIFTTCTTICPPLAATFAKIQTLTAERLGRDFHLISVSVDPATDTPARLKAWGAKFGARPGWSFVTGEKAEMDKLLRSLGAYVSLKEDHAPLVLIGNDAKGLWTRANGLGNAPRLVKIIDDMIAGRPAASKEPGQR